MNKRFGIRISVITAIALILVGYYIWNSNRLESILSPEIVSRNFGLKLKELPSFKKEKPIWFCKKNASTVAISIIFKNEGNRSFSKNRICILPIIKETLLEGTKKYSSSEIKKLLIDNSIELSICIGCDNISVHIYTISKNFNIALDLVEEILKNATYDSKKVEFKKKMLINDLKQQKFDGEVVASEILRQTIYADKNHPYYPDTNLAIKKLASYTTSDLKEAYNQIFSPDDAIINIVGNINEEVIIQRFNEMFTRLSKVKKNNFSDVEQTTTIPIVKNIIYKTMDISQSIVMFAIPGILRNTDEVFAYHVINDLFGGGNSTSFSSRLFKSIRNEEGLTYTIGSKIIDNDIKSYIAGFATTNHENAYKVVEKIKNVIKSLAEKGITREELEYFKNARLTNCSLENGSNIVQFLNDCRINGISINKINNYLDNYSNLDLEKVNLVIEKIFKKNAVFVIVGQKNEGK